MLSTLVVILLVAGLLGLMSGYTFGYAVYIILIAAPVLFLVGLLGGSRTAG